MRGDLGTARRGWRWVVRLSAWISGVGAALLMLPTVADVMYRKILGPSLPGMVEVSEVGLVVVAYLAMAAALYHGSHISTPVLTSRLPVRLAQVLTFSGRVLLWITLALMVWGSGLVAAESLAVREFRFGLVQMPIWPAKMAVPIGLLILLIELTVQMWESIYIPEQGLNDDVA